MKSTYLGRPCRSLPAARRQRGAGSTTSQTLTRYTFLKSRRSFRPRVFTVPPAHSSRTRGTVKVPRTEECEWRGRVRERYVPSFAQGRDPFTKRARPRIVEKAATRESVVIVPVSRGAITVRCTLRDDVNTTLYSTACHGSELVTVRVKHLTCLHTCYFRPWTPVQRECFESSQWVCTASSPGIAAVTPG